jgi:hypothetical protein
MSHSNIVFLGLYVLFTSGIAANLAYAGGDSSSGSTSASATIFDPNKKENTAVVTVAGAADKLLKFDTKLRKLLKIGPGDSDLLGCENCDMLSSETPPSEVIYIVPRKPKKIFTYLGAAWNHVWYHPATEFDAAGALTMHFEFNNSDDPLCEEYQPPTCYYRPGCPGVGSCSRKKTGSCSPGCS